MRGRSMNLNSMKKKSLLINIGRGDTIDENALIKYSRKNKNFMAILDVFKNVYTISSDTKIVSKILEIHFSFITFN